MTALLALLAALSAAPAAPAARAAGTEVVAVFAGGCFWGVEAVFEHVKGVVRVTSGYAGGTVRSPSYEAVSSGETGHAESVEIVFDSTQISYRKLLEIFFSVAHDPTQLNRQGPDVGTQYRSAIFYKSDEQKREAEAFIAELTAAKTFSGAIVTQVQPLRGFYKAEGYHQDFAEKHPLHPYIVFHDRPKVEHLKERYPDLYRDVGKAALASDKRGS
ncbi:MAG TPA: peptide-methionine (S)-S-oxide reductase MsrA [Gemmatimonadaceae bacterium]|nr:peptide-methionine (S)-S-oxide reductase MsrA [Gemmatimonadaceae bacterium]